MDFIFNKYSNMSLLDKASLILTPNAVKASKLYSIVPSNGNGDMTVVRATTATRVNSLGLIENVASNVARLNYEGNCPSLLLEPQRTNLVTYSEDFSFWGITELNTSGTPPYINQGISPNGTLTADKIIPNIVNGVHRYTTQPLTVTSGVAYTFSVFMKRNDYDFLFFRENINGTYENTFFNLASVGTGTIGAGRTAIIKDYGNGWIRCSVTSIATSTSISIGIGVSNANNSISIIGDNVKFNYIWGAQLEQGAYPTSYIPTVASTVTRNADLISRNNIYTNGLITSAGGTWFVELDNNLSLTRDSGGNLGIGTTSEITLGNSFTIRAIGTSRLLIVKYLSGIFTSSYITTTDTVKIAIKWNGTTADFFVNGVKVIASTAFTATAMQFFQGNAFDVPKYIKSTMLFPTPLTDTECQQLTTL